MISKIDHIALRTADLDRMVTFYTRLGAKIGRRVAIGEEVAVVQLHLDGTMLNIHGDHDFPLVARFPTPGSGDFCFRWTRSIDDAISYLTNLNIEIIGGPVARLASDDKPGMSIYFRDPDGNLLELLTTIESE